MKADVLEPCQPAILLGLVRVEVIEDQMQSPAGIMRQQSVHEVQKLYPAAPRVVAVQRARRRLERRTRRGVPGLAGVRVEARLEERFPRARRA